MENQFKGTKGKWYAVEFAGVMHIFDEPFYEGKDLLYFDNVGETEARANALLISKSPEMLKNLKNSNAVLHGVLYFFGNKMDLDKKTGIEKQIKENEELIKSATTL